MFLFIWQNNFESHATTLQQYRNNATKVYQKQGSGYYVKEKC